jgi:hypothetical protein
MATGAARMDDRNVTGSPSRREALLDLGDASRAEARLAHLVPTGEVLETHASASFVLLEHERALEEMQARLRRLPCRR